MSADLDDIQQVVIDPNNSGTIYVGTEYGVWKSTDQGESWTASNTGLTDKNVKALAIDPDDASLLYAGTPSGVFKSLDSGATWTQISSSFSSLGIYALLVDPHNTSTVYAGTYNKGVYKSINAGGDWEAMNSGLTDPWILDLDIDPQGSSRLFAAGDSGPDPGGVFVISLVSEPPKLYVSVNGDCGDKTPCHDSIQDAIDAAASGSIILVKQGAYPESIGLKTPKTVTVKGGFNPAYDQQTANTTFIQAPGQTTIEAPSGSLTLQMLTIRQPQ